jgi:uncharacterized RDD family membrane protein YckC
VVAQAACILAAMHDDSTPAPAPRALVGWRMLALLYDFWPILAMWLAVAIPFVLIDVAISGSVRHNIAPYSPLWWLQWTCCWVITGLYVVLSWRRGGQTLGMRPWRLQVLDLAGNVPATRALWRRYAVASVSLLLGGLGFWWAWIDRDRLTWHDRASGTRLARWPKRKRVSPSGA